MNARRNQQRGAWGEEQACLFLERHGFRVVSRNFHSTQGEIDIVATRRGDYYFIEVKTRESGELATDLAITARKRHRFDKTVKRYLYQFGISEGSFITAGLLVTIHSASHKVAFRLAAFC